MKDKKMAHRAEHEAREAFSRDIVRGMRKKRLHGMLKKPAPKEPDADDAGGYDALREMFDEKK